MRPVFLFDMGIIILFVDAAAGEGDRRMSGTAESQKMVVDKLLAVIGIDAAEREGETCLDLAQGTHDSVLAFAIESHPLSPASKDIRGRQGIEEVALQGIAAMGHGIDFEIPRDV